MELDFTQDLVREFGRIPGLVLKFVCALPPGNLVKKASLSPQATIFDGH
jgi:hypothetical protein